MLKAVVIPIAETPAPTATNGLPELTKRLVVVASSQILTIFKQIKINCQTRFVKAART